MAGITPAVLFCHPSMEDLALAIEKRCSLDKLHIKSLTPGTPNVQSAQPGNLPPNFTDGTDQIKSYRKPVEFCKTIKWGKFKDGWPNLEIENVKRYAGRDVIFIGSFHSQEVVFEQLSIVYSLPRYLVRSFKFILPYFPTGTMERVDTEGQVATAKVLATMLSSIPSTARGPVQIVMYDIHALQERFYFSDQVIPRLESAIPLLRREMRKLPEDMKDNLTIAFPDEGATKRFGGMFAGFPIVTCTKIREGDQRIVTVKEGEPNERHIIIVDDLVQTGGTLINAAKALLEKGAKSVSAYVTHAVFPEDSWKKFTDKSKIDMKYFWITDSIPHAKDVIAKEVDGNLVNPPFKLLSLCDAISDALLGYDLVTYN